MDDELIIQKKPNHPLHGCKRCWDWVEDHMGGMTFDEVVEAKEIEKGLGEQLEQSISGEVETDKTTRWSAQKMPRPTWR